MILIDEIENAGIDRRQAIEILAKSEKIVFISTHDPLLALRADKRIVMKTAVSVKLSGPRMSKEKALPPLRRLTTPCRRSVTACAVVK